MAEPVVGAVMVRSPVTVPSDAPLKQVACALLTADACAVPVLAASQVGGVVAVQNNLRYDVDDLLVTGF